MASTFHPETDVYINIIKNKIVLIFNVIDKLYDTILIHDLPVILLKVMELLEKLKLPGIEKKKMAIDILNMLVDKKCFDNKEILRTIIKESCGSMIEVIINVSKKRSTLNRTRCC